MELRYILIYLKKQILLGLLIGAIIPVAVYKFFVALAPKPNLENIQEFQDANKIRRKINKLKIKIGELEKSYLQVKYTSFQNNQKIILDELNELKQSKTRLKEELKQKEKTIEEKIMPTILWHETTLFYAALLAGTTSFLFGAATKAIPLASGLILGGLYCLFMAQYTLIGKLQGAINMAYVLIIILSTLFIAIFVTRRRENEI